MGQEVNRQKINSKLKKLFDFMVIAVFIQIIYTSCGLIYILYKWNFISTILGSKLFRNIRKLLYLNYRMKTPVLERISKQCVSRSFIKISIKSTKIIKGDHFYCPLSNLMTHSTMARDNSVHLRCLTLMMLLADYDQQNHNMLKNCGAHYQTTE